MSTVWGGGDLRLVSSTEEQQFTSTRFNMNSYWTDPPPRAFQLNFILHIGFIEELLKAN